MTIFEWPFTQQPATLELAKRWIARVTRSPNEDERSSRRRVSDHLRKAIQRKIKAPLTVPRDGNATMDESFWNWAVLEWPVLLTVRGFPYRPTYPPAVGSGTMRISGASFESIREATTALLKERREHTAERAQLNATIDRLRKPDLLADLLRVFAGHDQLSTSAILKALHGIEDGPWAKLGGRPLDASGLSSRLRKCDVRSKKLRIGNATFHGYKRLDVQTAWERLSLQAPNSVNPQ